MDTGRDAGGFRTSPLTGHSGSGVGSQTSGITNQQFPLLYPVPHLDSHPILPSPSNNSPSSGFTFHTSILITHFFISSLSCPSNHLPHLYPITRLCVFLKITQHLQFLGSTSVRKSNTSLPSCHLPNTTHRTIHNPTCCTHPYPQLKPRLILCN